MKLAIAGCGDVGRWVALLGRIDPRIQLAGCADLDADRVRHCAGEKTKVFTDYRKMLDEIAPDAVYIALPHDLHLKAVEEATERKLHVLCEKPLSGSLDTAVQAVRAARDAGVLLAVNYQYRYHLACSKLIRLAREGAFGRVNYIRCNVPWRRESSYFEGSPWHRSRARAGGGTLLTQAAHALDVALCAASPTGPYPDPGRPLDWRVTALTRQFRFCDVEVEDFAAATLELGSGTVVQLASTMAAGVERPITIELYGERATASCIAGPVSGALGSGFGLRVRWAKGTRRKSSGRPELPSTRPRQRVGIGVHPVARSLSGFRRWVDWGRPHLCPAEEALPVLAVLDAAYRSSETGKSEVVTDWRQMLSS